MRTFEELKRDRTFLDSVINFYGEGLVSEMIFDVFWIAKEYFDMDYEKIPETFNEALEEIEFLDEIPQKWLQKNIDIIPYFCDIQTDSNWNLIYGDEGWSSNNRIEFMKIFTNNKEMQKKNFIEMLYYENNEIFIFLCYQIDYNIKSIKAGFDSFCVGDNMNLPKEESNFDKNNYIIVQLLRTYDFIYTVNYGCGAVNAWAEGLVVFKYDVNQNNLHNDFSSHIQPLSVKNDAIYNEDPVSSIEMMKWLYDEI